MPRDKVVNLWKLPDGGGNSDEQVEIVRKKVTFGGPKPGRIFYKMLVRIKGTLYRLEYSSWADGKKETVSWKEFEQVRFTEIEEPRRKNVGKTTLKSD